MWDAAAFLLSHQIPAVVSCVWSNNVQLCHVQNVSEDVCCLFDVAAGLSRPYSNANGWNNLDFSAPPAGCECTISGLRTHGAGQDGKQRETQPRTGTLKNNMMHVQ